MILDTPMIPLHPYTHDTITINTIEVINISITSKSFLVSLCFIEIYYIKVYYSKPQFMFGVFTSCLSEIQYEMECHDYR